MDWTAAILLYLTFQKPKFINHHMQFWQMNHGLHVERTQLSKHTSTQLLQCSLQIIRGPLCIFHSVSVCVNMFLQ